MTRNMNYWMLGAAICLFGATIQATFWDHKYLFAIAYLCWAIANAIIFYLDLISVK